MDNNIEVYPDKSRMNIGGKTYNCAEDGIEGVFYTSDTGECVFLEEYLFEDFSEFDEQRKNIAIRYFGETDIAGLSASELYDLEIRAQEELRSDGRLCGLVFPYAYDVHDNEGSVKAYTVSEVPGDFTRKYRCFRDIVFEPKFSINLRLAVIANILDVIQALNEKFINYFQSIDVDSIYINIENGNVKIIFEKLLSYQKDNDGTINSELAFIIFELICMANPYDGKKSLVEIPLLTKKTETVINRIQKEFVFARNNNGVSKYTGREMTARWNAIPDFMRKALEDNLDSEKSSASYDINDWLSIIRRLRDVLVYVNGSFRFCNPEKNNRVLFFKVNQSLIPVWPRKAIYGYHVAEQDYVLSKKVVLGVNLDGKIANYTDNDLLLETPDKSINLRPGEAFEPKADMKVTVNGNCVLIVAKIE